MPNLYLKTKAAFLRIRNIGVEGVEEEELIRRIRLVNSLSAAIVGLILIIGILFFFLTWKLSILLPAILEFMLALSPLLLNARRMYVAAALVTFLTQCVASLYFGMLLGNVVELQTVVFFLLLITFLLFENSFLRKICFAIALLILIALEANYYLVLVDPLPITGPSTIVFKTLAFFGLFCLIIIVGSPYVKSHDSSFRLKRSLQHEEDRNQAKTAFIRNVSHEIQGAFLGIIKMAQSLRVGIERKEEVEGLSDELIDACHTYRRMLSNLLEYTKIDAGVMDVLHSSQIDIRAFAAKIININKYPALEKGVRVDLFVADEVPVFVHADEIKLTQVFNNLLTNAIKFTRVYTSIQVRIVQLDRCWTLAVIDEGPGVPEEKQNSIFDLFVTDRSAETNREGVGLGLFITRHLVEDLLHGTIQVRNQPEGGACFSVVLPAG